MEYMCSELLELSGNEAARDTSGRDIPTLSTQGNDVYGGSASVSTALPTAVFGGGGTSSGTSSQPVASASPVQATCERARDVIEPRHIALAISNDEELRAFAGEVVILGALNYGSETFGSEAAKRKKIRRRVKESAKAPAVEGSGQENDDDDDDEDGFVSAAIEEFEEWIRAGSNLDDEDYGSKVARLAEGLETKEWALGLRHLGTGTLGGVQFGGEGVVPLEGGSRRKKKSQQDARPPRKGKGLGRSVVGSNSGPFAPSYSSGSSRLIGKRTLKELCDVAVSFNRIDCASVCSNLSSSVSFFCLFSFFSSTAAAAAATTTTAAADLLTGLCMASAFFVLLGNGGNQSCGIRRV